MQNAMREFSLLIFRPPHHAQLQKLVMELVIAHDANQGRYYILIMSARATARFFN
jgi:hypothetical protein